MYYVTVTNSRFRDHEDLARLKGMEPKIEYASYQRYDIDHDVVLCHLFRVVSLAIAYPKISEISSEYARDETSAFPEIAPRTAIEKLSFTFFDNEFFRHLMYVAVSLRTLDERVPNIFDDSLDPTEMCCVVEDEKKGVGQFGLRETCNKVIHANGFIAGTANLKLYEKHTLEHLGFVGTLPLSSKNPELLVYLYGARHNQDNKIKWACELDLIKFADLVVKCVNFHRHQENINA